MFKIIADYDMFQICQNGNVLFVFEDGGDYIHRVIEIGRVPYEVYKDMTDAELLSIFNDYDYSGELVNEDVYCFWKLDTTC